jgi:hypothetical protein
MPSVEMVYIVAVLRVLSLAYISRLVYIFFN